MKLECKKYLKGVIKVKKENETVETSLSQREQISCLTEKLNSLESEIQKTKSKMTDLNKDSQIYISIGDLVQEVSAITNIPKDELTVELEYIRSTFSRFPKYHLLEVYKDTPVTLMLKICDSTGNTYVNTSLYLSFTDKTSDGKTLIDHSLASYIDFIDLMILKVIEEYIPTVIFKVNFKKLAQTDNIENKAIINCLKKQKYMTEEEVKSLTPSEEKLPENCQFINAEDGEKVLVMTLSRKTFSF